MRHSARITRIALHTPVDVGIHTCCTLTATCEACSAGNIIVKVAAQSAAGEPLQEFSLAGTVFPGVQEVELPSMMERSLFARIGGWRIVSVTFMPLHDPSLALWGASTSPSLPLQIRT